MITLENACILAEKTMPGCRVNSAFDIETGWIFGFINEKTGIEVDLSPTFISKETGEAKVFFPPDHIEELDKAIEIEIPKAYR